MRDMSDDSQISEATLFDVDEFRASETTHRTDVGQNLSRDLSPAGLLLPNGLPQPTSFRWKPLRCGLVNLYLFDNEIFPFADGRLLLRGDNGAGKSRVLALTLPLLLDGRLHPSRVEPDRDSSRQVAWNLLMDEYQDRTGYTWIEFGRLDENSRPYFVTLGIGLRAVRSRGITDHWMFVTSQRVGESLSLLTPDMRVSSKRTLIESLGDSGQLYESSTDYRRAVDELLFRLNDRYEALLDLLLQLRQPQLAKKLDLAGLEAALVQAMPPVSSTLLSDAADAFRSLDQEREILSGLQNARITVKEFLRPYRRHLRLGIRRAAGRLRACHSRCEQVGKELQATEQKKNSLAAEMLQGMEQRDTCLRNQKAAFVALQTLQADPGMKHAERLNGARLLHQAAAEALARARMDSERLQSEVEESIQESAASREETSQRLQRAIQLNTEAAEDAAPEELQRLHTAQFGLLLVNDLASAPSDDPTTCLADDLSRRIESVEQTLGSRIDHWLRTGRHLADLSQQVQDTAESLKYAVRRLDNGHDRLQFLADEQSVTDREVTAVTDNQWQQLKRWSQAGEAFGISPIHGDPVQSEWFAWADTLDGVSPAVREADAMLRNVSHAVANERSRLIQRQKIIQSEQDGLNEELLRLHAGGTVRPVPPATQDTTARLNQSGAALWELVEFVAAVPHEERAGWEAALEGSGLLDAWIHPDGKLVNPGSLDVVLSITDYDEAVADVSHRLSTVLAPTSDSHRHGVAPAVLNRILDRIGTGSGQHHIWIDASGRWQNGPLTGRRTKPVPQFVGRDVREAWQERRIEEIDTALSRLVIAFAETQERLEQLAAEEKRADEHRRLFPDDGPLRSAVARQQEAHRQCQEARQQVTEAASHEQECREQLEQELTARNTLAMDLGLLEWADHTENLVRRLEAYRTYLTGCIDAWQVAAAAANRQRRCAEFGARKCQEQQQHRHQLRTMEQTERSRQAVLDELQQTVGVDSQEIIRRISLKETELRQLETDVDHTNEVLRQAEKDSAKLEAQLETLSGRLADADTLRCRSADALLELARLKLLPAADDQLADVRSVPESSAATVELARRIEKLGWRGPDIDDDEAWKRNQRQIYDALEPLKGRLAAFSMNAEPEFVGEHICLVQIRHQAELLTPDVLVKRLNAEVDEHERVLSENERMILEKHLLGEVAGELHERIHLSRELVDSMNREVSSRPMKTGMQMRFRWEPDREGQAGLSSACRILATGAATWSDGDRRELGEFLHEQIMISREQENPGSRLEQLTLALDYRRWHRLRIDRRASADQEWKLLTRRTYGSGSGGEKAIALTLPQMAAAAAYYRTADPLAPRLILMDEVFAGISTNNRAACMELLAAFELDVVMTSESEWGCYATVPQLAICQLTRMPDLAAIDNTVFVWTGTERVGMEQSKSWSS